MKSKYIYLKYQGADKIVNFKNSLETEIRNLITELLIDNDIDEEIIFCEVLPLNVADVDYVLIRLQPSYILDFCSKKDISNLKNKIVRLINSMKIKIKETTQNSALSVTAANHVQVPDKEKAKKINLINRNIKKINGSK